GRQRSPGLPGSSASAWGFAGEEYPRSDSSGESGSVAGRVRAGPGEPLQLEREAADLRLQTGDPRRISPVGGVEQRRHQGDYGKADDQDRKRHQDDGSGQPE